MQNTKKHSSRVNKRDRVETFSIVYEVRFEGNLVISFATKYDAFSYLGFLRKADSRWSIVKVVSQLVLS